MHKPPTSSPTLLVRTGAAELLDVLRDVMALTELDADTTAELYEVRQELTAVTFAGSSVLRKNGEPFLKFDLPRIAGSVCAICGSAGYVLSSRSHEDATVTTYDETGEEKRTSEPVQKLNAELNCVVIAEVIRAENRGPTQSIASSAAARRTDASSVTDVSRWRPPGGHAADVAHLVLHAIESGALPTETDPRETSSESVHKIDDRSLRNIANNALKKLRKSRPRRGR